MRRTVILIALLTATSMAASERGLDLTDPAAAEACALTALITQGIAEQALAGKIPARRTEMYRTINANPALSELADVMATAVDRLDGVLTPPLVRAWSMYGYCHGFDDDLIFGAAGIVGVACNMTPEGDEDECIERFLKRGFDALSTETQREVLEAARERGY